MSAQPKPAALPSSRAIDTLKSLPRQISGVVLPVERMTLHHAFDAACTRAEEENHTWHDLRHEALSHLFVERHAQSIFRVAKSV
ncbi:MAG: hypothetical protein IV089_09505 [Thiobacillus sp.]|nr:hypothetical protein [Thiobacillus sp.]